MAFQCPVPRRPWPSLSSRGKVRGPETVGSSGPEGSRPRHRAPQNARLKPSPTPLAISTAADVDKICQNGKAAAENNAGTQRPRSEGPGQSLPFLPAFPRLEVGAGERGGGVDS